MTTSKPTSSRSQPNRQQLVAKMHKVLKSHYKSIAPNTSRSMLEQVLFACCLENASYNVAEKALAKLSESYFDLNEIRVTTVAELAESLAELPDPSRAALSLRRVLQGVFESTYSFSLEHAKKHSIAHGIKTLEHLHGIPRFVVAYVTSTALGGHFVPLDLGAMSTLYLAGILTQQEYDAQKMVGLERFVSKKAGQEFSSLLHQFGVDCLRNVHGVTVKKILQSINPAVKDRFPKRGESLAAPNPPAPVPGKENQKAIDAAQAAADVHRPAGPQAAARPAGKTPLPPPGSGPKRTADGTAIPGTKSGPKPFVVKPNVGKPMTIKLPVAPLPLEKAGAAKAKTTGKAAQPTGKAVPTAKSGAAKKNLQKSPAEKNKPPHKSVAKSQGSLAVKGKSAGKNHSLQLAKRKPR